MQEINIRVLKKPTTMFPELRRRHYLTVLKIVIAPLYPWGWTHEFLRSYPFSVKLFRSSRNTKSSLLSPPVRMFGYPKNILCVFHSEMVFFRGNLLDITHRICRGFEWIFEFYRMFSCFRDFVELSSELCVFSCAYVWFFLEFYR